MSPYVYTKWSSKLQLKNNKKGTGKLKQPHSGIKFKY